MVADQGGGASYVPVADVSIDTVRPVSAGFALEGRGSDGADYRLELHLDLPVSARTRAVLGEMLAQSEWRVSRRVRPLLASRRQRGARMPR